MVQSVDPSRRRVLFLLAVGAAVVATGCRTTPSAGSSPAGSAAAAAPAAAPRPVPALPPVPVAHPGRSRVVFAGPANGGRLALTVDDGTAPDVVAGYVAFAQRSGIHLTFSPNGIYDRQWAPHAAVLRPLIALGQVQIMNHTFTHRDLRTMTEVGIRDELERNDAWVVRTFGTTTRPYYRPPFGFHDPTVDGVAGNLGWTRTMMWNASFSDSEVVTPEFLMAEARKYLKPGAINLGHANHPTVLGLFDQLTALIRERRLEPVTLDEMFGTSRATGAG